MKKIVKTFNNLIKKTIFKVLNKTNINFKIGNLNVVKKFNNSVEKAILRVQNKTIIKLPISKFNTFLITFISLLFFYLFYLSIPILYDKAWVQRNIESQLLKEFKINFSTSSDISYYILPKPHFLLRDSKIFKEGAEETTSLVDIKNLKVFISQKNLFNKERMILENIKIDDANFSILRNDFSILNNATNNQFSNKKIEINNSIIFFKDNLDEIIGIIKINKAFLFFDKEKLLNLFNLKAEVFNIPFVLDIKKKINSLEDKEVNISAKTLKLNIFNKSNNKKNITHGNNIISFLNSTINTHYIFEENLISFESGVSRINKSQIEYNGKFSVNPFDLNLNVNLGKYKTSKILDINFILSDLIKTKLLFNENISVNTSIIANSTSKEIFQDLKINFNITNGKINFDKTILINDKIGSLKVENSNLSFENNKLTLSTDILIDINNSDKLFSLLQTNKRFRKPIKNILINLDYEFLTNQIEFNNIKIDNKELSVELLRIMEGFNNNNFNNLNKSRRLLNELFSIYDG